MKTKNEILLIDDDDADIELALDALRENSLVSGIQVLRDGEEVLDYLFGPGREERQAAGHTPRLILLDSKLPKVDGIEVLRRVKSDPATKSIPVVILTSSTEERDLASGYELGANSYIHKPVDYNRFRELVKQVGMYWLAVNQPSPAPIEELVA